MIQFTKKTKSVQVIILDYIFIRCYQKAPPSAKCVIQGLNFDFLQIKYLKYQNKNNYSEFYHLTG